MYRRRRDYAIDLKPCAAHVAVANNRGHLALQRRRAGGHAHTGTPSTGSTLALGSGPVISRQKCRSGIIFCGFRIDSGLYAFLSWIITARSSSVNMAGIRFIFSRPTPCSPVIDPPYFRQHAIISLAAFLLFSFWMGSRAL